MFKSVSDSAAAADGGSLALFVERFDGEIEPLPRFARNARL